MVALEFHTGSVWFKSLHVFRMPLLSLLCHNLQQRSGSSFLGKTYFLGRVHCWLGRSPAQNFGTEMQQATSQGRPLPTEAIWMKTLSQAWRKRKGREVGVGAERVGGRQGCFRRGHGPRSLRTPGTPSTRARPIGFTSAVWQLPSNEMSQQPPMVEGFS